MAEQDDVVYRVTTRSNGLHFLAEIGPYGSINRLDLIAGTAQVRLQGSELPLLVGFVARVVAARERLQAEYEAAQPAEHVSE